MSKHLTGHFSRRGAVACLTLLIVALANGALAQTAAPRTYAMLSLVGDSFTVVERGEQTGSRLDRNPRTTVPIKSDVFDRAALGVADDLIRKADPRASPLSLLIDEPALYAQQQNLFDGRFVRLPASILRASRDAGASHMLLITKHREDAAFKMLDSTVGQGTLSGLGFYVEPQLSVRHVDSKESGTGFLGLYAVYRLTVVDLSSEAIVSDQPVAFTQVYTNVGPGAKGGHPWQALTAAEKVKAIADMLMQSLRQQLPALLARRQ